MPEIIIDKNSGALDYYAMKNRIISKGTITITLLNYKIISRVKARLHKLINNNPQSQNPKLNLFPFLK